MAKQNIKVDPIKEKWDKLEHYKCDICKYEFYFIKKELEKEIKEDEFAEEPFTRLPIFPNEGKCPECKARKKCLIYIPTDEEIRLSKEAQRKQKMTEKEKLKEELEKLKEEEKRLDELHSEQLESMCSEIFDDTFKYLDELEVSLRKKEINIDNFERLFLDNTFSIIKRDTDIYNKRNPEITLVLSNSFIAGFRNAILDFNRAVRDKVYNIEKKLEENREKLEKAVQEKEDEIKLKQLENECDKSEDEGKDKLKYGIKDEGEILGKEFLRNLKKELR